MKKSILIYALFAFFALSCGSDPCEEVDNVECETGDIDGDGVLNGEDSAPLDPCVPNAPSFAENVVGKWAWSTLGGSGNIEIFEDGTYLDPSGDLLSNGDVVESTWAIENITTLALKVVNADGLSAGIDLKNKSFDCDKMVFEGFFSDLTFTRQ